ncbi:MAG: hypothetical protein GY903_29865 [Fuerstiella sp.]|nr:hypothetical protein [Fuerstiella sp.]MCP4858704.1 hypothetical protein [Fuerstiella sp.]
MSTKPLCVLLCVVVFQATTAAPVLNAQGGEDIARGLLRALIESQLEKSLRRNGGAPNSHEHGNPGDSRVTPEMLRLRPITASYAQESAALSALLNTDARRSFEVRRQLQAAIQLQANATALNQRSAHQANHLAMLDEYRGLNSEWTTLSHQLDQCRSLSAQTRACIKRVARLDAQYCSLLGIQEQFNNSRLTREAYTLTAYLRDLVDDVQDTAPRPGASHNRTLRSLGRLNQEADYFAQLVSRGVQFKKAVTEYRQLYRSWQSVEEELEGYSGNSMARTMRRIRESHQTIHELLRLEIGIDRNLVLHLIHEIDDDLTGLFKSITLDEMMALPDADALTEAADAVYGNVQNLDDLVHREESPQAIAEAWVYADEAWEVFAFYVAPSLNAQTQVSLRSIGQAMQSLKHTMGINVSFDRNALVRSASSLENMGEHLVTAIRRWQTHPGNHNRNLVAQTQELVDHCHHLEQSLAAGRNAANHRQECDEIVTVWQKIRPELKKCDTDERETINHIIGAFTPELIRLRTMLDE